MTRILKPDRVELDTRPLIGRNEAADHRVPAIVTLAQWLQWRTEGLQPHAEMGIWLDPDDLFEALTPDLQRIGLIAVNFPVFTDGRGYSVARLLRERLNYTAELRAIGDILRDQLYFLRRCGFDAFALRADQDIDDALRAFDDYSVQYQ